MCSWVYEMNTSIKASQAATRFIGDLRSGKIKRDILPQSDEKEDQEESFKKFCEFTKSDLFKKIMEI